MLKFKEIYRPQEPKTYKLVIWVYVVVVLLTLIIVLLTAGIPKTASMTIQEVKTLQKPVLEPTSPIYTGIASYYDYVLDSGWSSVGHKVAAMRDIPRGTMVLVTNLDNNRSVVVKITDFGPDKNIFPERIIDLSSTAFSELQPLRLGLIKNVKVEIL